MTTKSRKSLTIFVYFIIVVLILMALSSCSDSIYTYAYNSPNARPYNTSCGAFWNKQHIKKASVKRMASFKPSKQ